MSAKSLKNTFLFMLGVCIMIVRSKSAADRGVKTRRHTTSVNLCSKNNGGCHNSRKCMDTEAGITCGDCPTGWINDGRDGCNKTAKGPRVMNLGSLYVPFSVVFHLPLVQCAHKLAVAHTHSFGACGHPRSVSCIHE